MLSISAHRHSGGKRSEFSDMQAIKAFAVSPEMGLGYLEIAFIMFVAVCRESLCASLEPTPDLMQSFNCLILHHTTGSRVAMVRAAPVNLWDRDSG